MKKFGLVLGLALLVLALAACTRSASEAPALPQLTAAPTQEGGQPEGTDQMSILQTYATQTAMAESGMPGLPTETPTPEGATPAEMPTNTPEGAAALPSVTPVPSLPTSTPAPVGSIAVPGTYALQQGEFPFCIARRFNVDPDELLALNGLRDGATYPPGLVLKIPQTGKSFPFTRALLNHPTTYTVGLNDTIYSIACKFGDVSPEQIAAANGLSAPYNLQVGQSLSIP